MKAFGFSVTLMALGLLSSASLADDFMIAGIPGDAEFFAVDYIRPVQSIIGYKQIERPIMGICDPLETKCTETVEVPVRSSEFDALKVRIRFESEKSAVKVVDVNDQYLGSNKTGISVLVPRRLVPASTYEALLKNRSLSGDRKFLEKVVALSLPAVTYPSRVLVPNTADLKYCRDHKGDKDANSDCAEITQSMEWQPTTEKSVSFQILPIQ